MKYKQSLIKVGYSVEVSNIDEKKVLWEVIEDHIVEEGKENDEIVLQGSDFILFEKTRGVGVLGVR